MPLCGRSAYPHKDFRLCIYALSAAPSYSARHFADADANPPAVRPAAPPPPLPATAAAARVVPATMSIGPAAVVGPGSRLPQNETAPGVPIYCPAIHAQPAAALRTYRPGPHPPPRLLAHSVPMYPVNARCLTDCS